MIFLAFFLPLAFLLWVAQADTPAAEELPDEAPMGNERALFSTRELGLPGLAGRVVRIEGVDLRLIHEDKIRCYARLGKLVRHEGRLRVQDVLIALFSDGVLQMTIQSPYAEGDPSVFLARQGASRIVSLGGGVVVYDRQGRERARVDRLDLDVDKSTLRSDDRVTVRLADYDVELSADGFFADLSGQRRSATVGGNVTLSAPVGGGTATLRCKGPATLVEQAAGAYLITLTHEAAIEHPLANATCDRIVALVRQSAKRPRLVRTTLSGNVRIDIDTEKSSGLRSVRAPLVTFDGEHQILLRNFTAVRQGSVPGLGPEERTIDLKAARAALILNRVNDRTLNVWEVSLKGGVEARDRNGPSYLLAESLLFNRSTGVFEASGGIEAKTPDGFVRARRLHTRKARDGRYDLVLEGVGKRIEYTVDGKLGPLGAGRRARLVITCDGPLRASVRKNSTLFSATETVHVALGADTHLQCERLSLFVLGDEVRWLEARDKVLLVEGGHGAELRGDLLLYRDKSALLRGTPARVRSDDLGTVRARTISYRDGGEFVAIDAVAVATWLTRGDRKERWVIYCSEARGALRKQGPPKWVEARGTVIAKGPERQLLTGTFFRFDGKEGAAVLRGDPAVVQRGKELRLQAPQIDLRIRDKKLATAETLWPATIDLRPTPRKAGGRTFARWSLRLKSGARFSDDRLEAPLGGTFIAYDEKGVRQISGAVGRATIFLKKYKRRWNPSRLLCTKGVKAWLHGKDRAEATAQRLEFWVGRREIDLRGNAHVKAKGWAPEATFQRLIFQLTKDGVDLMRASRISIREPRR